jgi:UDP-N-acetylglucosamine 2-epimerase (non-hydrolysing)
MKIISVVGARPNFMKIAPFIKEIDKYNLDQKDEIEHILVHTGQHYDDRMNKAFFDALDIPAADINLEIGSGTHAEQVGQTMIAFEKVLKIEKPDWVVVVGDVNATLACSVTAKKEHIKVCHVEAGLRSGDLDMPEEINRLVTDRLSDLLLTPDKLSIENLRKEGVPENKINFVGNIMIDTLEAQHDKASQLQLDKVINENLSIP